MKKNYTKKKFYDRYSSLFSYKTTNYEEIEIYDIVIIVPKKDNFKQHLENVRRLLKIEFGGVFNIVFWDEKSRTIDTDIPYNVFYNNKVYHEFFTDEVNEKIDKFWNYKNTGENVIQKLW